MVVSMKVNGDQITCMDMVCIPGEMAEDMRASMNKIRNMAMVYMCGLMAGDTRVIGIMENSTVRASIFSLMAL